jgi:menaquinol-cytochrome c reductase iron-sulfur subunit
LTRAFSVLRQTDVGRISQAISASTKTQSIGTAHFYGKSSGTIEKKIDDRRRCAFDQRLILAMNGDEHSPTTTQPEDVEPVTRRSFLGVLLGFGTAVVGAALSAPLIRFALHPLLTTTTEIGWSDVGPIDEFTSLSAPVKRLIKVEQRDAWRKIIAEKAVYVLPMKDSAPRVLSPICPHLGCSIPWNADKQQFICPCHVAVFAMDGAKISGPPPRAMDDLESKVENGILKVRYQYFRQLIPQKEALS